MLRKKFPIWIRGKITISLSAEIAGPGKPEIDTGHHNFKTLFKSEVVIRMVIADRRGEERLQACPTILLALTSRITITVSDTNTKSAENPEYWQIGTWLV